MSKVILLKGEVINRLSKICNEVLNRSILTSSDVNQVMVYVIFPLFYDIMVAEIININFDPLLMCFCCKDQYAWLFKKIINLETIMRLLALGSFQGHVFNIRI